MSDPTTGPWQPTGSAQPPTDDAAPGPQPDAPGNPPPVVPAGGTPQTPSPFRPPSSYRGTDPIPPSYPPAVSVAGPLAQGPVTPQLPVPQPTESMAPPPAPGSQPDQGVPAGPWGVAPPAMSETPRRRRAGSRAAAFAGVAVLALAAGAVGGIGAERLLDDDTPASVQLPRSADVTIERAEGSVADIANKALPSVVALQVDGADGVATGSGFVLRSDGYILTNNHVVADRGPDGKIVVLFADGHESTATLVGSTADYDLAVVRVKETGLTPLTLGDSDKVVVGDPVVAVGAPLGLNGTVTTGIVSALHRPVQAGESARTAFIDAIQTDAAINPGNSGGPLVNAVGEVIGINSAIAQPPGATSATGSIGLGFAIPSNQVRRTAEELINDGEATYPVIGVVLDSRYQGEGVRVATEAIDGKPPVTNGGPADKAGIKAGDIILSIDGRPVTYSDELIVAIRAKAPGDSVTLKVRTGTNERDVRVVLDEVTSE